jgi:hypothetical protein
MKNTSPNKSVVVKLTSKIARKTPVSKNPDRVDRQLMNLTPKRGAVVLNLEPGTGNVDKTIKEIKAKQKPATSASAKPEATKRMLSKIGRAYKKAGTVKGGGTTTDREAFAHVLLNAGVPILARSSSRIAKAIRGEIQIADLMVSGGATPKRSAAPKKAATKLIAEQPISAGALAQLKSR